MGGEGTLPEQQDLSQEKGVDQKGKPQGERSNSAKVAEKKAVGRKKLQGGGKRELGVAGDSIRTKRSRKKGVEKNGGEKP